MSFTGKATYTAGASLPEVSEDVSDLVAINSPHETPLLDVLGDPNRSARSTVHEWLEDQLLPNTDSSVSASGTSMVVLHANRFRVGDQIRCEDSPEILLVTAVSEGTSTLTVTRNYGGTASGTFGGEQSIQILGNAALEGDGASAARFAARSRISNYTQIFSSTVEVSGSELAVRQLGLRDELDYQKNQRTRELLRDLENSVINGVAPSTSPQGSTTVRRTMRGIASFVQTNRFDVGDDLPDSAALTEEQLNLALRSIWNISAGQVDLIVVGGVQKRAINNFVASSRRFASQTDNYAAMINTYESDFGVCRIVLSRFVQPNTVLLLDSSRIEVMPLAGRSFQYKPLGTAGDKESGIVVGEYTLELRNENAHGVITGFGE